MFLFIFPSFHLDSSSYIRSDFGLSFVVVFFGWSIYSCIYMWLPPTSFSSRVSSRKTLVVGESMMIACPSWKRRRRVESFLFGDVGGNLLGIVSRWGSRKLCFNESVTRISFSHINPRLPTPFHLRKAVRHHSCPFAQLTPLNSIMTNPWLQYRRQDQQSEHAYLISFQKISRAYCDLAWRFSVPVSEHAQITSGSYYWRRKERR